MTIKMTVQAKRKDSLWNSMHPVTKVFSILFSAACVVLLLGIALDNMGVGIAGFGLATALGLLWLCIGFGVAAKSRGANSVKWGFAALAGFVLAPIGTLAFWFLYNAKVGDERRGFCPSCDRRIAFDLPKCPFCKCMFE